MDWRTGKLSDKGVARVDEVQQMNAVHSQPALPSFVQRTNVAKRGSNLCNSSYAANIAQTGSFCGDSSL